MKDINNYMIHGSVTSEGDGYGVTNLKVEAWDRDAEFNEFQKIEY